MSFRRLIVGVVATLIVVLAAATGSAGARTVYDYQYSGSYFDGSAGGKAFDGGIASIAYDRHKKTFLVANGDTDPTWIGQFKADGQPVNFSALGSPYISLGGFNTNLADPALAVDQSGGPTEGNIYIDQTTMHAFRPDGTVLPGFRQMRENSCGVAVNDAGEPILATREGFEHFDPDGKLDFYDFMGSVGLDPTVKRKWGERGRICRLVFDSEGNAYGVRPNDGAEPGSRVVKTDPEALELFEVNPRVSPPYEYDWIFGREEVENPMSRAIGIDYSNDDVFILGAEVFNPYPNPEECPSCFSAAGDGSFAIYDSEGRTLGSGYGGPEGGYLGLTGGASGIAVDPETHDVWVANKREYAGGARRVEKFERTNPHTIADATALAPDYPDSTGETIQMHGIVNPDGVATTSCRFEIADSQFLFLNKDKRAIDCAQGTAFSGSEDVPVSASISVTKGKRFWYRLVVENADGYKSVSNPEKFLPQGDPDVDYLGVDRINTDGVRLQVKFDPNGGNASYRFEWGQNGNFEHSTGESKTFGFKTATELFGGVDVYEPGIKTPSNLITDLIPGETYDYRVVVTNEAGSVTIGPKKFTTYLPDPGSDPCANAQVRQQTESSLLPDCRGYELVSAPDSGGYDVESDLVPGQAPPQAFPRAQGKLLYSLHFGVIPGIAGSPTNNGLDPYVATRGPQGWSTRYVGVPADGMADNGSFGSPLLGADADLSTFAFGGPEICDPCFDDGSINVPLRLPDSRLVKGMAGGDDPAADPVGEIRKPLSEAGSHLVFGADQPFADGGPEGAAGLYQRDLESDITELISTDENGDPLGGELAELDQTADGGRVLFGENVGEDDGGNSLYDLYMHLGDAGESVPVIDTPDGVVYAGMSADGGQVFFSTAQQVEDDSDAGADLYRADLDDSGAVEVTRVSTGSEGAGDGDGCTPITNWNVVVGGPSCGVVAIAGGGGVAPDGTAYFVSPELLDGAGNGEADQANLYVVDPGEDAPRFVATIDSSLFKPGQAPPNHPVETENLVTGLEDPEGLAIDQDNGDIYVAERGGGGFVSRFAADGGPKAFSAGPGVGSHRIPGYVGGPGESAVAVDSSDGALDGAIYATGGSAVNVYDETGAVLGQLTGFGYACGVAVDQATGDLYVGDYNGVIKRFEPNAAAAPLDNSDYTETAISTASLHPCHLAADGAGHLFAVNWDNSGPLQRFAVADFSNATPTVNGTEVSKKSTAMYADASTGELYNDEGNKIVVYASNGEEAFTVGSAASIGSSSLGVAVDESNKHVYALNGGKIVEFGLEEVPYEPIDNPAVVHGLERAGVRSFEDFQLTPDGRYALFSSAVPLTGYENQGHTEIYRYDAEEDQLACPSCAPTGAVGEADARLSPSGSNLTDDGRVFFTTKQSFTLRDTNEKLDAYEWSGGKLGLISTGIGQYDSGLVTVSADGADAFFFTRETLVPEDRNGRVVKVYSAHAGGGYPFDPPRLPCAASDECHGVGTQAPGPPNIETETGAGVEPKAKPKRCKKGFVKRKGKCVKRKHRAKKHKGKKHKGKKDGGRR